MFVPYQLTILVTSTCTTACAHCCVNASPSRRDRVTFADIRTAIDGVCDRGPLATVIFAGGEPTLAGEILLDGIAYAHARGINTRVITNASWATTRDKAAAKVLELREAGLQEINISADDFHEPDIPFANVERAWHACRDVGFSSVVVGVSWGPESRITPTFVRQRLGHDVALVEPSGGLAPETRGANGDGTLYAIHSSLLQLLGRARTALPRHAAAPVLPEQVDGPCPFAVRSPTLSPRSHLVACCGIEAEGNAVLDFGSIRDTSVAQMFERADDSVAMQFIARVGPKRLLDFLAERDPLIDTERDWRSVCEVCEFVTTDPAAVRAVRRHSDDLADTLVNAIIAAAEAVPDHIPCVSE